MPLPNAEDFIETDVPARLDRLLWSRFHSLVVAALGVTWILDGLEVTLVGSLSVALARPDALGLSATEIGTTASAYLAGAIIGAIAFGYLTDYFGRKRLFLVTVAVYATATVASGLSWNFASFALFRFATGAGIGGEYAAINSAIQELIPARCRGRTDLAVNGSFWAGAMLGAIGAMIALDTALLPPALGWRLAFAIGGMLGIVVVALRRYVPESPRWLMTHGRVAEAERVVAEIERRTRGPLPDHHQRPRRIRLRAGARYGLVDIGRTLFRRYRQRTLVGLVLMAAQAFLYNSIFFTYALILTRFNGVPPQDVSVYILSFAFANLLGPLLLGRLFDSVGRKIMISATYGAAAVMMAATALLFDHGMLDAQTQTAAWMAIFFLASAGASAAYLTVGESFPLEIRALTIAIFYAFGTAIGGLAGPVVFGALIASGSRGHIMWGYLGGAALMLIAALAEASLGVAAERRPLEEIAAPLGSLDNTTEASRRPR